MAKPKGLIDEIKSHIPSRSAKRWTDRVAPDHLPTLNEIKRAYHAGEFGSAKKPACDGISKYLHDHGIATVGFQGVLTWLETEKP